MKASGLTMMRRYVSSCYVNSITGEFNLFPVGRTACKRSEHYQQMVSGLVMSRAFSR